MATPEPFKLLDTLHPKKNTGADEARVPWLKTAGWLQRNDTVDGRKPGNPLRLVGYPIKNRVL